MSSRFITCVLMAIAFAGNLAAQSVQGVVTGTVTDISGASVPNAELTLTNDSTNISQIEKSNNNGFYRFGFVPPGTYMLVTRASGFTAKEVKSIVVDASKSVPVNVTLSIASAQTVVEVTTQETMVQTASSDLSSTVDQKTIENMPLLTRNVFDLAFAAPAVTQGMNFGAASGGARESGTTYLLNGADNNDNFGEGGVNINPPLESVSEFTMLTNNMSAEYGHASGALVSAVQKSGGNSFHGAVYEFNRNASFNASDFFSNRDGVPNPHYIRNQFGGEVDGPIIRNKTFFTGAFDRVDLKQGSTLGSTGNIPGVLNGTGGNLVVPVPTSSELAAMTAGAGPIAQQYLKKFSPISSNVPCPNEARDYAAAVGHMGCITVFDPDPLGQNVYTAKVDHNFSANDRLSFTANILRSANDDKYGGGYVTSA